MLHVGLRGLHMYTGLEHVQLAGLILDALERHSPAAVLVPTFTYSFNRSGIYHRDYSRSEAGRFSEEVRIARASFRTLDPVFSVVDTKCWLEEQTGLQFDSAFEPGCLWERLLRDDAVILNIGINTLVATQVHYLERCIGVPYRSRVVREGVIYLDKAAHECVTYDFYARDLKQNRLLDWPKIEAILLASKRLISLQKMGVKLSWIGVRDFHEVLEPMVSSDPYYLLRPLGSIA